MTRLRLLLLMQGQFSAAGGSIVHYFCRPNVCLCSQEFVFHSIFACPVAKEAATATNPPRMLPCGHVLCKLSIEKIAKSGNRPFKCPYCPSEASPNACETIFFPDIRT